jgi:D-hexose-6-phosphate mutarotase
MKPVSALRRLEIPQIATFDVGKGNLPRLAIRTPLAEADIYLHGAHVTHFRPAGQEPVLFMSEKSLFAADKAIRGGVPLIFPWFGARTGHPESPAHGFARTTDWQVESLSEDGDGVITAVFHLGSDAQTQAVWPSEFRLRYRVAVGRTLSLTLEVETTSTQPFSFENALHTYLAVHDARETSTTGLEDTEYLDKTDNFQRKNQGKELIRITQETDRVYENTRKTCIVEDPGFHRRLIVEKSGSQSTVVWNPWVAKAAAMADFGDDEWPRMLCIETANVGANAITLAPEKTHSMRAVISVA